MFHPHHQHHHHHHHHHHHNNNNNNNNNNNDDDDDDDDDDYDDNNNNNDDDDEFLHLNKHLTFLKNNFSKISFYLAVETVSLENNDHTKKFKYRCNVPIRTT